MDSENESYENDSIHHVDNGEKVSKHNPVKVQIKIANQEHELELDTGSRYNLMTEKMYSKHFRQYRLTNSKNLILTSFTNGRCKVLGKLNLKVEYNGTAKATAFIVIQNGSATLLGREFMDQHGFKLVQARTP